MDSRKAETVSQAALRRLDGWLKEDTNRKAIFRYMSTGTCRLSVRFEDGGKQTYEGGSLDSVAWFFMEVVNAIKADAVRSKQDNLINAVAKIDNALPGRRNETCPQCRCETSVYGCFVKDEKRSICKSIIKKTMKCVCMGCGWRGELPIAEDVSECPECGCFQIGDAEKCPPSGKGI